jgi:hypothetical protein
MIVKHIRAITESGRVESVLPIDKTNIRRVMRLAEWFCVNAQHGDDSQPPTTRPVDGDEYQCCDYCLGLAGRTIEWVIGVDDELATEKIATQRPKRRHSR